MAYKQQIRFSKVFICAWTYTCTYTCVCNNSNQNKRGHQIENGGYIGGVHGRVAGREKREWGNNKISISIKIFSIFIFLFCSTLIFIDFFPFIYIPITVSLPLLHLYLPSASHLPLSPSRKEQTSHGLEQNMTHQSEAGPGSSSCIKVGQGNQHGNGFLKPSSIANWLGYF